jgi:predicted dehydrogenase
MNRHDILFVGMSSVVTRRVLPAVLGLKGVGAIHVASRRTYDPSAIPPERRGHYWNDYDTALRECGPCLTYISLPNAMHAPWVRTALDRGFHVIVDKPAVVGDFDEAEDLVQLAMSRSAVLAEASVWPWHPIADELRSLASRADALPLVAIATFTSPPMDPGNFRYSRRLGGGAILDRGSYAASCGRILFGVPPVDVSVSVISATPGSDGVDLSLAAVLTYPRGALMCYFSIESEYQNRLELIGRGFACSGERVFTPPPDYSGIISVRERDEDRIVTVPMGDTFARFIQSVLDAIDHGDCTTHSRMLREDARVLGCLWAAASGGDG